MTNLPIDVWVGFGAAAIALLAIVAGTSSITAIEQREVGRREAYAIAFITHHAAWMALTAFTGILVEASTPTMDGVVGIIAPGFGAWGALSGMCLLLIVFELTLSVYRAIELALVGQPPRSYSRLIILYYVPSTLVAWLQFKNIWFNNPTFALMAVGFFGYAAVGQFSLFIDALARTFRQRKPIVRRHKVRHAEIQDHITKRSG